MKLLPKLPRENARSYAIRVLMYNIQTLQLPPGSSISENELSAALSLSRTPIREALIELSRMDLVEIIPQRGSYVTKISYDRIEESKFLRLVVEVAILKLACQQGISQEYLDALEKNLEAQRQCVKTEESETLLSLDDDFHKLLFQSVNKDRTYDVVKREMLQFDRLRIISATSGMSQYTIQDHEDILYALRRGDAEMAEMLMTRHLTRHNLEKDELHQIHPEYFVD